MARDAIATLPNIVSLSRLGMAALFPVLEQPEARLGLIAAAAATDFLDGYLARRRHQATRLGALIDPIADRCFVLIAVWTMWAGDVFSVPVMLVLVARDVVVALAFAFARKSARFHDFGYLARPAGKVTTVLQLATLAAAYLRPSWMPWLVAAVGVSSAAAIADYARVFFARPAGTAMLAMLALGAAARTAGAQGDDVAPVVQPEVRAIVAATPRTGGGVGAGVNVPRRRRGWRVAGGNARSGGGDVRRRRGPARPGALGARHRSGTRRRSAAGRGLARREDPRALTGNTKGHRIRCPTLVQALTAWLPLAGWANRSPRVRSSPSSRLSSS
jgi:phosphatidylglycerophosphate synthase